MDPRRFGNIKGQEQVFAARLGAQELPAVKPSGLVRESPLG